MHMEKRITMRCSARLVVASSPNNETDLGSNNIWCSAAYMCCYNFVIDLTEATAVDSVQGRHFCRSLLIVMGGYLPPA